MYQERRLNHFRQIYRDGVLVTQQAVELTTHNDGGVDWVDV